MTTMSYCAIENTRSDLGVCYRVLSDLIDNEEAIGEYEQRNLSGFIQMCRDVVALYEAGLELGTIDEQGRLHWEREETDA